MISKREALERLTNSSIRTTVHFEDPLIVHLIVMACYDALREYAKEKNIFIEIEWTDYIKDEYQKRWVNDYFKNKYYFLKHGTADVTQVSFENITLLNDMQILHNITMYQTIFKTLSAHMKMFLYAFGGVYPHLMKWEKLPFDDTIKRNFFALATELDRKDLFEAT